MSAGPTPVGGTRARLAKERVHVIRPRGEGVLESLRELWLYRRLVRFFGRAFLEKRYARTWLGWLWLPLRPLATVSTRTLVFGGVLGVSTGSIPYVLFFLVGQGAWQLFAETALWSTRSLELSRNTLKRIHIPRLIPLVSSASLGIVDWVIYFAMTCAAFVWYAVADGKSYFAFGPRTTYALAGLVMLVLLGLGIGLWTSVYATMARDVRFTLSYVLSLWYFFTPVIFPFEAIPAQYRTLASLNPATAPVELVKVGLLGEGHLTLVAFLIAAGTIAGLWGGGLFFFWRREDQAAESL